MNTRCKRAPGGNIDNNRLKEFFVLFYLFISFCSFSQEIAPNNSIYLELYGNGEGLLSINYERKLKNIFNSQHYFRIGFSRNENIFDDKLIYVFPLESTLILGKTKRHLETGLGITFIKGTSDLSNPIIPNDYKTNFDFRLFTRLGYRLIETDGFLFRVSPLLVLYREKPLINNFKISWTIGISGGYTW